MKPQHILIFGADGQLGGALRQELAKAPVPDTFTPEAGRSSCLLPAAAKPVPPPQLSCLNRADADLTRPEEIRAAIRGALPDIIINAAAYTTVDRAESEPALAEAINADAVAVMAEEAARRSALFIHYSTDYVFNGRKPKPYIEEDAPHPLSAYGRSKLAGERYAARTTRHLIFRTSWLYSATGRSFPRAILEQAKHKPALRVVADQCGAPTPASLIAAVTAQILAQIGKHPAYGLYHLTAGGAVSWNGFARFILARARENGLNLAAGPEQVAEIATEDYPVAAVRPKNSRLSCRKLCETFSVTLPEWQHAAGPVIDAILREERHETA